MFKLQQFSQGGKLKIVLTTFGCKSPKGNYIFYIWMILCGQVGNMLHCSGLSQYSCIFARVCVDKLYYTCIVHTIYKALKHILSNYVETSNLLIVVRIYQSQLTACEYIGIYWLIYGTI